MENTRQEHQRLYRRDLINPIDNSMDLSIVLDVMKSTYRPLIEDGTFEKMEENDTMLKVYKDNLAFTITITGETMSYTLNNLDNNEERSLTISKYCDIQDHLEVLEKLLDPAYEQAWVKKNTGEKR